MVVLAFPIDQQGLDEYNMRLFLEDFMIDKPGWVKDYSFVSRGT